MKTQPERANAALAEAHAEIERWKASAQTCEVCEVEAALAEVRELRAKMARVEALTEACRDCGRNVTVQP